MSDPRVKVVALEATVRCGNCALWVRRSWMLKDEGECRASENWGTNCEDGPSHGPDHFCALFEAKEAKMVERPR